MRVDDRGEVIQGSLERAAKLKCILEDIKYQYTVSNNLALLPREERLWQD